MGVSFKRKAVQSTAPTDVVIPMSDENQDLTERQTKALIEAGILPSPEEAKPKKVWRTAKRFVEGDRVVVAKEGFDWIKFWKPGDLGTVLRVWPPVPEARFIDPGQGCVEVALDTPRVDGHTVCVFQYRDLDKLRTTSGGEENNGVPKL